MNTASSIDCQSFYLAKRDELAEKGLVVLPSIYSKEIIQDIRSQIFDNLSLLRNTRATEPSLHLAGFHRYPEFENLHSLISCNETVSDFLKFVLNGQSVRNIGITDITINRSQCWHKDLLRGPYASFLEPDVIWNPLGEVFRILMYLQDSSSLKFIPGSHLEPISLNSDDHAIPNDESKITPVPVRAGDLVIMDVRTTHRGAEEKGFKPTNTDHSMLVATALGADESVLSDQLEIGNSYRLRDWMKRNYYFHTS
ncbi:MAG: phytanoyl-CoA dioxygenase family protein [Gammaproteobacteria bacterium]|nr:phytanoyl-CoA dioxygenase family protein [Gammaproteobacteria bacterium]